MSTTTSTSTTVITRTHTATYLAEAILGTISEILGHLGISLDDGPWDYKRDASAIAAWIEEESLREVIVECHQPDGTVDPVFEFPVRFTVDAIGDAVFTTSTASLAKYRAKITKAPKGSRFELFCSHRGPHSSQPGWSAGTRASTIGLQSSAFGTVASGPHAAAAMRYLHKPKNS
jgi:hypothetical protein